MATAREPTAGWGDRARHQTRCAVPGSGRAADFDGYGTSLVIGGIVELIGIPFLLASRRQRDPADRITAQADADGIR
ncbi:hypothetical protein GY21_17675 [Cryobacterium roopkundense]|uniref:Uncharacterized protein n=1 Tax=Cryobacterium roopkundense TaxID=1001240 RepID=A0A099J1F6_9MICO|nr:hypothetical protein [Cryobacterium roopkundense]KGJ72091.1 hypothetical protein GY21_17675 [Cryobacterium roopkundense]MBB5640640.1 hypothetical protein [Cryobacterium roopkundense]